MTEKDKIKLQIYQEILCECRDMYPEYIPEYIIGQIDILKQGI